MFPARLLSLTQCALFTQIVLLVFGMETTEGNGGLLQLGQTRLQCLMVSFKGRLGLGWEDGGFMVA